MSNSYKTLAVQVLQQNSQIALKQFQGLIQEWNKLEVVLDEAFRCHQLMFVLAELLSKSILRGDFLAVDETRSQDGESQKAAQLQRMKIYSTIMGKVYQYIKINNVGDYLLRSCMNLVTLCLKSIFERSIQIKITTTILQDFIQILLPGFLINEQFTNNYHGQTVLLQIRQTSLPDGFHLAMKILTSLLQYVTTNAYFKSYYDFRRNIYTFRNSHLPILLNISIQYIKLLFKYCQETQWNVNEWVISNLSQNLSLLDGVFTYPFTLSLHEYDNQMQSGDNISGAGGQIYFPHYFRNVLADRNLISNLSRYYSILMTTLNNKYLPDLKKLIRVIGRMISSSGYSFNTDDEKITFRGQAVFICMVLASECRHDDPYLLTSISDIIIKILNTFSHLQFNNRKPVFLETILRYANLMIDTRIILSEGKKNPLNSVFEIITLCISEGSECSNVQAVRHASQNILQKLFLRMIDGEQTFQMIKELGQNNPNQIEVFQQLFSNVIPVFQDAIEKNLSYLLSIDFSKLNESSKIFFLHFTSILLPSQQAKSQQTKLILKYFQLAKSVPGLASLHYIHTLVDQIMMEMEEGISITALWKNMEELTSESFNNFILFVLKTCFNNFTIPNMAIIDYSLEVFKSIYVKLKKNDKPQFEIFYGLVRDLITNINGTVFINPKFFKKRASLFNVISIIWLNSNDYKYCYQIYELVQRQIRQDKSLLGLIKFIIDITGLLQPLQLHEPFQILSEVCINDLAVILPQIINSNNISNIFSESHFIKMFLQLVLQLCNDNHRRLTMYTHSKLQLQIHELFYPYLTEMLKYQYPKILITVWSKFILLNLMGQLLPLRIEMKSLDSPDYQIMLREYFSSIHRCKNLDDMYQYIEGNVEWMSEWWQEVIYRGLLPNIKLKEVVQARIWATRRQKQIFAKMLYSIGRYNANYWSIPENWTERIFVNHFMETYN